MKVKIIRCNLLDMVYAILCIEYFEKHMKDKIWDWHEIMDDDIIEVSQKYSLHLLSQDLMQSIAWCSREKS